MQVIQKLHTDINAPKGFLKAMIRTALESKQDLTQCETDTLDLIKFNSLNKYKKLDLKKRLSKLTLLSNGGSNPKTAKKLTGYEFQNYILHLTPSDLSGVNLCPAASRGCRASCLNGAGRGLFNGVQIPRLRKTLYYTLFKSDFLNHLSTEIGKKLKKAKKQGIDAAFRLNGTSDIPWESLKLKSGLSIFETHTDAIFYDYTKVISRLSRIKGLKNYKLTVSASESNDSDILKALKNGVNAAVVFDMIPKKYLGFKVIDGDAHDFRFLDPTSRRGFVVGLKAKGPAKKDRTGFVKRMALIEKKAS